MIQFRPELIDGLARPGGNITGISDVATTLTTKRLSLLKDLSPNMRRVAMLWNKDDIGMTLRYEASCRYRLYSAGALRHAHIRAQIFEQ